MADMPETDETAIIRSDDWLPGETCTVRTYQGSGARRRIRDATMQFAEDPLTGQARLIQMNTAGATLEKLTYGIVSWTLVYPSGKPIPLTPVTMEALPDAYADFILAELTRLWSAWGRPSLQAAPPATEEAAQEAQATF